MAYHVLYYVSTSSYHTNQPNVGKCTYHTWILWDMGFSISTFLRSLLTFPFFSMVPGACFLSGHLLNYSLYTHNPQRQEAPVI